MNKRQTACPEELRGQASGVKLPAPNNVKRQTSSVKKTAIGKRRSRQRTIVPVVAKYKMGEEPNDFAYWQTRPYSERISALEEMRHAYMLWKYGAIPRLQRVYRVVKQKS